MSRCLLRVGRRGLWVALFFPGVQVKKRRNNREQNNLPKYEDRPIEATKLVARILIDDERAKRDAHDQPDNLSLRVPHRIRSESFGL